MKNAGPAPTLGAVRSVKTRTRTWPLNAPVPMYAAGAPGGTRLENVKSVVPTAAAGPSGTQVLVVQFQIETVVGLGYRFID